MNCSSLDLSNYFLPVRCPPPFLPYSAAAAKKGSYGRLSSFRSDRCTGTDGLKKIGRPITNASLFVVDVNYFDRYSVHRCRWIMVALRSIYPNTYICRNGLDKNGEGSEAKRVTRRVTSSNGYKKLSRRALRFNRWVSLQRCNVETSVAREPLLEKKRIRALTK